TKAVATAATAAPRLPAAVTTTRAVIVLGRRSGSSTVTMAPDGTITTMLDMLENGRGPHADATIRLAADGTIASLSAKGHHTFGARFEATCERTADHARWNSSEESGEREVHGPAFYYPVAEIPEVVGWLAQAALSHGGSIAVLPAGTARIEKAGEI